MKHTTCFLAAVAALAFASDGQCAEAGSVDQPSAPKTYCNPMPLPGIPVNSGCRNGKPSRTPGSSYREIADPSFLYDNGTLYLYPSMGMAWKSKDCGATWEFIDVGVYDLGYAPTAVKHRGKYYLTTGGSQLHVADSPEGPFKPIGRIARPKVDGKEMSYDDPMLFSDDDERLYVYFGCSPRGGIWGIELDSKNPLAFIGEPKQLIKFEPEEHPWECKPNRLDEAWMEGSWLTKINGRYCLVFSSSGTENNTYAMGAAWSDKPLGPFVKQRNNPFLRSTTGVVRGTSHGSIIPHPIAKDRFMVAYSILVGNRASFERLVGFDNLRLDANGEFEVSEPTETPQYADGSGAVPWYRLPFTNPSRPEATDQNLKTWSPIYEYGAEPVFKAPYSGVIRAVRICWADLGMDYANGAVPGPYKYLIQYRFNGKDGWKTLVDRRDNEKDLYVDYVETPRVRADEIRIKVSGAPKGITPAISDISVFVE